MSPTVWQVSTEPDSVVRLLALAGTLDITDLSDELRAADRTA
jgi:hypothetical protein